MQEKAVAYTAIGFCDNILQTLYELQQSQKLCDVSLEAKDGSVSVHSLVFAACSTFFQQWLLQKPVYKKKKLVFSVPEVTLIQLKELTEFFYTGRLVLTTENIDAYQKLFEKLCIQEAVALCNEYISSQVKTTGVDVTTTDLETRIHKHSRSNSDHIVTHDTDINTEKSVSNVLDEAFTAHEDKSSNMSSPEKAFTSISDKNKESIKESQPEKSPIKTSLAGDSGVENNIVSNKTPVRRSERSRRASAKYISLTQEKVKTTNRKNTKNSPGYDKKLNQNSSAEKQNQTLTEQVVTKKDNIKSKRKPQAEDETEESPPTKCRKLEFTVSGDDSMNSEDTRKTRKRKKKAVKIQNEKKTKKSQSQFECEFCGHLAVNQKALEMHKHSKHDIPFDPTRHKIYTCKICGYETLMSARLDVHIASHSDERPFVCESCGKSFKLSCELTMHARVHTNPSMLDCTHCGKTFSTVYNLKDHIEHQHYGRKKFLCHLCCHRAINRLHLDRHLYKVHGIPLPPKCKLFTCELCNFESFKQYRFTEHMKRHKGEKDYICVVCKKGFVSHPSLARHMIWHGG